MGRRKKVRLEQIAEAVGSSVVTVSNALNDRKGGGEELRSRIKETKNESKETRIRKEFESWKAG